MHCPPRKQELLERYRQSFPEKLVVFPQEVPLSEATDAGPSRAAVGLVLAEREAGGFDFLLTLRAFDLTHHAGQVSLPGGRLEPTDYGNYLRALDRELFEETGLASGSVEWVESPWEELLSRHGVKVRPFVGFLKTGSSRTLSWPPGEVSEAVWLPLESLFDAARWTTREMIPADAALRARLGVVSFEVWSGWSHVTWGLTARFLELFIRRISGRSSVVP